MKTHRLIPIVSKGFVLLSACSLCSVSLMAFYDPKAVMQLVNTPLTNTDAYSSIRGVYGGVGMSIFISLLYLLKKNMPSALAFLGLLWGLYALSRTMTIFIEGPLGAFGSRWLIIESIFCVMALSLYYMNTRKAIQ